VKVRCCLCGSLTDYEARRIIEIRYNDKSVEYAVCSACFQELRNATLLELAIGKKGGRVWSKSTEQSQ